MNKHARYGIALAVALAAGASGCTNAAAQTPATPARTLTADTDINQLASGLVKAPGTSEPPSPVYYKVNDGPFVLTDAFAAGPAPILYALPAGQDCTLSSQDAIFALDGTNGRYVASLPSAGLMGTRLLIKAGEELCASWSNQTVATGLSWSGFKPY